MNRRSRLCQGIWTPQEDANLTKLVREHGPRNWSLISTGIPGRSGNSCPLRWCNQLSPPVQHRPFSLAEDDIILHSYAVHGNRWATIACLLPGRTDKAIKNHWNSTLRRCCNAPEAAAKRRRIECGSDSSSPVSTEQDSYVGPETCLTLLPPGDVADIGKEDEERSTVEIEQDTCLLTILQRMVPRMEYHRRFVLTSIICGLKMGLAQLFNNKIILNLFGIFSLYIFVFCSIIILIIGLPLTLIQNKLNLE